MRTGLGAIVAGDLFMYFERMSKICIAVIISQHLEFSLGLQCERHWTHTQGEFLSVIIGSLGQELLCHYPEGSQPFFVGKK